MKTALVSAKASRWHQPDLGVRVPGASNKGLFTRLRGRVILRTSDVQASRKFAKKVPNITHSGFAAYVTRLYH
jgi:hypothetical protein